MKIKNIVLGVTGGIAAYKAAELTSRLKKEGYDVRCVMTKSAQQFLSPLTLQTLSNHPVITDLFAAPTTQWNVEHIALAKWADVFIIAPATANIIGKMAAGIGDDFLSTCVMATKAPIVLAPAMNEAMYEHQAVVDNIALLKKRGCFFIEPAVGKLACGDSGKGRMEEPNVIVDYLKRLGRYDLTGKKILITAGPTREALDPVRFLTNHSSGRMGYALAEAAYERGALVTLISGPVNLAAPTGVDVIKVDSALAMYEAVLARFDEQDAVIKAAAVADYRPETVSAEKIKKKDGDWLVKLVRNPDILAELGGRKTRQILVGFAAETNDVEANARKKLVAKNLDLICANDITEAEAGFGTETNRLTIYRKDQSKISLPLMSKKQAADLILDQIGQLWQNE